MTFYEVLKKNAFLIYFIILKSYFFLQTHQVIEKAFGKLTTTNTL